MRTFLLQSKLADYLDERITYVWEGYFDHENLRGNEFHAIFS